MLKFVFAIIGWLLSALIGVALGMGAVMNLLQVEMAVKGFTDAGYPKAGMLPLGIVTLAAVILYLLPRTSVFGAIVLTGFLGGAVATHLHASEFGLTLAPVIAGVLVWLGVYFRDNRVRDLMPWPNPTGSERKQSPYSSH